MTATTIIVALALAKILLEILAVRQSRAPNPASPSRADSDEEEESFELGRRWGQFEDSPTGNLPSEEYSAAAGSRQFVGDFRDPDDHHHQDSFDHYEPPSMFDTDGNS